ncbi:arsenite efflux MFS transporter ArsK [Prosthecomicrobium pneumaticum]|uniref:MFS family permease n=1 Tax=Prosthecomicrobium pneumaticum TaxID=81895 RepID=A0A7W9L374_9HYPH|nr:arsenite efflux MFS transporter ArsK [Prosthecomicrobium pneumaticum]MBB5754267.1 MFS family permease [Prosthecomicrobium pneumaticum]
MIRFRPGAAAFLDVAALGLTQIIGYGTLYYSFGILAPAMARDLGWPQEWVFGALSAALLIGGLVAPRTGRWIDRFGAGRVMAAGSLAAAAALVVCALAPSGPVFFAGLVAIEVASTFVQYGAAFPLLVQRHPDTAPRRIVHLTLIAGFASTLFWPLTTALHAFLDWRTVYLVFAGLNLGLALPIHLWLARPRRGAGRSEEPGPAAVLPAAAGSLPVGARRRGFLLMATAFALQSFAGSALLVHMLPILGALGLGLAGVTVGALFGPAQVASRLINMLFGRDLSQRALAMISAGLMAAALVVLTATAPSFVGAAVFAVLFGMGSGLQSLVGGTLPLALFGAAGYGAQQGRVTSIRLVVGAAAPFAFALMIERIGPAPALGVCALACGGALAAFAAIARLLPRPAVPDHAALTGSLAAPE